MPTETTSNGRFTPAEHAQPANGRGLLRDSLSTAAVAGLTSTFAAAALAKQESQSPLAPVNAVSHIVWGDAAATHDEASLKYTATGLALHAAAVTSWAMVHEACFGRAGDRKDIAGALLGGACVSLLAYVTDYYVVPRRLTPGFELRVSPRSLLGIYAALAIGLGVGSLCRANGRKRI